MLGKVAHASISFERTCLPWMPMAAVGTGSMLGLLDMSFPSDRTGEHPCVYLENDGDPVPFLWSNPRLGFIASVSKGGCRHVNGLPIGQCGSCYISFKANAVSPIEQYQNLVGVAPSQIAHPPDVDKDEAFGRRASIYSAPSDRFTPHRSQRHLSPLFLNFYSYQDFKPGNLSACACKRATRWTKPVSNGFKLGISLGNSAALIFRPISRFQGA